MAWDVGGRRVILAPGAIDQHTLDHPVVLRAQPLLYLCVGTFDALEGNASTAFPLSVTDGRGTGARPGHAPGC
jgi:hypothetical protein